VDFVCDLIPFRLEKVPLKKLINWWLLETSIHLKATRPWGRPTHLTLEPTALCNLRCALCPVTKGMTRPKGHMDTDLFRRLIDEIGDYLLLIMFWDWGEPLFHPKAYEMIHYAHSRNIKVITSSNGHLLARGDNADKLIKSGLDALIVAVDGITQETYQRYRQDGNLELVLEGIRKVVEKKRILGSPTPLINFRFIVMRHNEHEIPQLKDFARSLGADALTLRTLNPVLNRGQNPDQDNIEMLPRQTRYRRFAYAADDSNLPVRLKDNPCRSPWNNPAIHWDGTVCSCYFDYNGDHPMGDLKTTSFRSIWYGENFQRFRRAFRRNWEDMPLCGNCSYAFQGGDCGREIIRDPLFFDPSDVSTT